MLSRILWCSPSQWSKIGGIAFPHCKRDLKIANRRPDSRRRKRNCDANVPLAIGEEDNDSARLVRYSPEHEIDPSRDRTFGLRAFSGTDSERGGTGGSRAHRIGRRKKGPVVYPERSSEPRRLARFAAQERAGRAGLFSIGGLVTLLPEAVGPTASQLEGTGSDRRSGRGH